MKRLIPLLILLAHSAFAAIAFVSSGTASGYTSGGSLIPDITLNVGSAANRVLFVWVATDSGCGYCVSNVTYNGVSMTKLTQYTYNSAYEHLFFLVNPAAGSSAVHYTFSVGYRGVVAAAWAYSGALQSTPTNFVTGSVTQGSPFTESLTTSANNSWLVGVFHTASSALNAGTGTTSRTACTAGYAGQCVVVDNTAISPPGSTNLQVTAAGSITVDWILMELNPATELASSVNQGFVW